MSNFGLFDNINHPLGSGLFTVYQDIAGDTPTPPGVTFLAAENSDNFLTESGDNLIIE
jgi:hypothetical protein